MGFLKAIRIFVRFVLCLTYTGLIFFNLPPKSSYAQNTSASSSAATSCQVPVVPDIRSLALPAPANQQNISQALANQCWTQFETDHSFDVVDLATITNIQEGIYREAVNRCRAPCMQSNRSSPYCNIRQNYCRMSNTEQRLDSFYYNYSRSSPASESAQIIPWFSLARYQYQAWSSRNQSYSAQAFQNSFNASLSQEYCGSNPTSVMSEPIIQAVERAEYLRRRAESIHDPSVSTNTNANTMIQLLNRSIRCSTTEGQTIDRRFCEGIRPTCNNGTSFSGRSNCIAESELVAYYQMLIEVYLAFDPNPQNTSTAPVINNSVMSGLCRRIRTSEASDSRRQKSLADQLNNRERTARTRFNEILATLQNSTGSLSTTATASSESVDRSTIHSEINAMSHVPTTTGYSPSEQMSCQDFHIAPLPETISAHDWLQIYNQQVTEFRNSWKTCVQQEIVNQGFDPLTGLAIPQTPEPTPADATEPTPDGASAAETPSS